VTWWWSGWRKSKSRIFVANLNLIKKKKKINEIPGMDGEKERINSINSEKKRV